MKVNILISDSFRTASVAFNFWPCFQLFAYVFLFGNRRNSDDGLSHYDFHESPLMLYPSSIYVSINGNRGSAVLLWSGTTNLSLVSPWVLLRTSSNIVFSFGHLISSISTVNLGPLIFGCSDICHWWRAWP